MEVADQGRARSALTFLSALFFIEAGALVVSAALTQLGMRLVSMNVVFTASSFMWLGLTCALAYGAWNFTQALEGTEVVWVLLGAVGLTLCLELYFLAESLMDFYEKGPARTTVTLVTLAAGLAVTLSFLILLGRLGRSTAFAVGVGAFAVVRSLTSIVITLRLADERPPGWVYSLRTLFAVAISIATGVLALRARNAITGGTNVLTAPVAQQPIMQASGMRLIVTGVALLVLGVGVTAGSYSAASSGSGGGQYVIATGAIATGLVQLVRGISRLGSGS